MSQELDKVTLPGFLETLKDATINNTKTITDSPATINAMVNILENIARRVDFLNITINEESTRVCTIDLHLVVVFDINHIGSAPVWPGIYSYENATVLVSQVPFQQNMCY